MLKIAGLAVWTFLIAGSFFLLGLYSRQEPAKTVQVVAANLPAPPQVRGPTIIELHGHVTVANYPRFEKFISENLNNVVGLQLSFDQSRDEDALQANASSDGFSAYLKDGSSEIVASRGVSFQHGFHIFDGFFLIKSGGMHQGVVSYGLVPANEDVIRLSGNEIRKETLR